MAKRHCAWGVDASYRFKWQANMAGLLFRLKTQNKDITLYADGDVKIEWVISFRALPFFRLSVPNISYNYGLIKCIKLALRDLAAHEMKDQ